MKENALSSKNQDGRSGFTFLLVILVIAGAFLMYGVSRSPFGQHVVDILNTDYGKVCRASLQGFFERTLRVDWTRDTVRLHCIMIFKKIDSVKEDLVLDGVRYFEFPNDGGTYNVIDWKTGRRWSNAEHAEYYFK